MTVDKYTTPLRKLALHEVNALREKCECIRNFSVVEIDMSVSETLQQRFSDIRMWVNCTRAYSCNINFSSHDRQDTVDTLLPKESFVCRCVQVAYPQTR